MTAAHALVSALARASLGGALLAGLAVAAARAFPRTPAAARAALLWLGCARMLVALAPAPALEIPVLPAGASSARHERVNRVISTVSTPEPGVSSAGPEARGDERSVGNDAPAAGHDARAELWVGSELLWVRLEAAALAAWAAGAAVSLVRLARERRRAREILRGAATVPPAHPARDAWRALGGERRGALGLLPAPRLALSPTVRAPLCAGLLRPTVVLPTAPLPERALRAALAHELGHLRRGDLWLAWIPALAEALLWFHPLARLAAREHAQAREEACDAFAVRRAGVDPAEYGPLLLAFGTGHRRLSLAAAAGAPHVRQLERRLRMLLHVPTARRARLATAAAVLLAAPGLVPVALSSVAVPAAARADSAAPVGDAPARVAQATPPAPMPAAPATTALPALPAPAAAPDDLPLARTRPTTPIPPTPPRPPGALAKAPPPPPAPPPPLAGADFLVYTDGDNSWIMTDGDDADVAAAGALVRGRPGPVLVFGRGGKSYVVDDRAALEPFRALFQDSAGPDAEQARTGLEQARIGRERAELERRRADVEARRADLEVQRAETDVQAASGQLDRKALERRSDELSVKMDALGSEMDAIGRQMDGLGRRMDDLGRRTDEAGRRSEERARKAQSRAKELLDGWIRSGVARPVKPPG